MNNSLYFILILISGISCSEPENKSDLTDIYNSLLDQRHLYYNVEYTVNNDYNQSATSLYGMVSFNRGSESGISSGYFGLNPRKLPNYLHSMYLKNDWICNLSSNIFNSDDADILTDSLHSPILINPELLFEIEANSSKITKQTINDKVIKWTFNLNQKPEQLVLVWNENLLKLTELEYKYNVKTEANYSRKWVFDYLTKSDYRLLASEYKHQNQITHQPFL